MIVNFLGNLRESERVNSAEMILQLAINIRAFWGCWISAYSTRVIQWNCICILDFRSNVKGDCKRSDHASPF